MAELIQRQADVSQRTAHGILPMELAQPNCALLIRQEASRRIKAPGKPPPEGQERQGAGVQAGHRSMNHAILHALNPKMGQETPVWRSVWYHGGWWAPK